MIHLGDICKIDGGKIEPVDCITFGSPCQDLSIAGRRAGLSGERSGLFNEAIRVVSEMREASGGKSPKYLIWENVPGAFSSNGGEDFHEVLSRMVRLCGSRLDVPRPEGGVWRTAGAILGDEFSIAWRTHNAEYWGVPQRRYRLSLVVSFGTCGAGEILFEQQGVFRDITEDGIAWEADTAGFTSGVTCTDSGRVICYGMDSYHSNSMKSPNPFSGIRPVEVVKTLDTSDQSPNKNQGGVFVLAGNAVDRSERSGCGGRGYREGSIFTLNATDRPSVAFYNRTSSSTYSESEVAGTLTSAQDKAAIGLVSYRDEGVRRLTLTECERFQGYPDGWTDVGGGSDSARYRALGNSIALPFWRWLLGRLPECRTLGSLFDGIGGFPRCWEAIHGAGTARWASEIERFPILVTKERFGNE